MPYADAGADGIYPIFVQEEGAIAALVKEFSVPVNILITKGTPELKQLENLGVARVSFGPNFQKAMLSAMKASLKQIKETFSHNGITSVYLSVAERHKKGEPLGSPLIFGIIQDAIQSSL